MEFLIVLLLAIIAYQLYNLAPRNQTKQARRLSESEFPPVKRPAFTEEEWDEAVAAWYKRELRKDRDSGLINTPYYDIWQPPSYDSVKYDQYKLDNLRAMAGQTEDEGKQRKIA